MRSSPIASLVLTPNDEKDQVKQARETKLDVLGAAAGEQAALHRLRRKRSVRKLVLWAVASVAGLLVTRLEKAKDNADPATKPTETLPGTPPAR